MKQIMKQIMAMTSTCMIKKKGPQKLVNTVMFLKQLLYHEEERGVSSNSVDRVNTKIS